MSLWLSKFYRGPVFRLIPVLLGLASGLPGADAPPAGISISVEAVKKSEVNSHIFGMMTEHYLEKWHTDDSQFIRLVKEMGGVSQFQYPGGTFSKYWHYSPGVLGYGIKQEEVPANGPYKIGNPTESYLQKYIRLCKQTGAEAIVAGNVLRGTPAELDGALREIKQQGVRVLSVILGVELHLKRDPLTPEEYAERAKNYVEMLHSRHPEVKIYAWAEPMEREEERDSRAWNARIGKLAGIDGLVQYQWCRNGVPPGRTLDEQFDNGMKELQDFFRRLDVMNGELQRFSPHWTIDQWGMVDRSSPGGAKSFCGATMLQFIHTCWYLFYTTDYNHRFPGFYQSLEFQKLGSPYDHDPLSLKNFRDAGSGYQINPAYHAFQLVSCIKGAKYAPARVADSSAVKTYFFEKLGKRFLFTLNLDKEAIPIRRVTVDGKVVKPVLQKAYWADKLYRKGSEIQTSTAGDGTLKPYSVSLSALEEE